jgi:hypothetical protein
MQHTSLLYCMCMSGLKIMNAIIGEFFSFFLPDQLVDNNELHNYLSIQYFLGERTHKKYLHL